MTLREIYQGLLTGDSAQSLSPDNTLIINANALKLYNKDKLDSSDLEDIDLILRISNILYNNSDIEVLPLEDGMYDLLLEKYKQYNPNYQVGSEVVMFANSKRKDAPPRLFNPFMRVEPWMRDALYVDTFNNGVGDRYMPPYQYQGDTRTDRGRDTSHSYPELVGTLDKCKFVTDADARNAGIVNDPTVKIFEKDFLAAHMGMLLFSTTDIINMVAELKYDGISVEADVCNHIISARTRGDLENNLATDLTDILGGYRFPNDIPENEAFGMKFEAIITKWDLARLEMATGKRYTNMRTAIAGIFGLANARDYIEYITLVPLATSLKFNNRIEEIEFMNRFFAVKESLRYTPMSGNYMSILFQVRSYVMEAEKYRDCMPFAYDGVVVSYTDQYLINALGRQNHVNKYSVAIKFGSIVKLTRFRGYQYTVGKNGTITPMIMFDPVEFNGTIHYIASGHSYERFKTLGLRYGDIIKVSYVNDVMPYVTKYDCVENHENPNPVVEFINQCPSCGSILDESMSGKSVRCPNPNCSVKIYARVDDMLAKLNFRDFSLASIESLGIKSFSDLIHVQDASSLGEVNGTKFLDRVNELRTRRLDDFTVFGALGFTDLSIKTWKLILREIKVKYIVELPDEALFQMLVKVKGVGRVSAETIVRERHLFANDIQTILSMPNVVYSYGTTDTAIKAVISGVRDADLVQRAMSKGVMILDSSVTKDTSMLIIPFNGFHSSKVEKAMKYGIPIIDLDEFRRQYLL